MRRTLFVLVPVAVLIAAVLTVALYFGGGGAGRAPAGGGPAMLAGAPVQSYTIARYGGGSDAVANYRGRVVLVNLWASWCAPCRSETPALEKLSQSERGRGLVVLGIDQGESAEAIGAFARELHLSYPLLVDADQQYGRAYASVGLPTSIFVDRSGHIARGFDGELSLAEMHRIVDPLLAR